jgi:hypothetical protein
LSGQVAASPHHPSLIFKSPVCHRYAAGDNPACRLSSTTSLLIFSRSLPGRATRSSAEPARPSSRPGSKRTGCFPTPSLPPGMVSHSRAGATSRSPLAANSTTSRPITPSDAVLVVFTADSLRLGEASAISFVACGSGSNRPFRLFQGDLREEQGIGADNRRRGLVIVESGVIGSISLAVDLGPTGARSRRSIAADIFCLIRVIDCMITFIWNY